MKNTATQEAQLVDFTPAEFARLWNCKMAIKAGYYSDQLRLAETLELNCPAVNAPAFDRDA